jgi:hypothetical protein
MRLRTIRSTGPRLPLLLAVLALTVTGVQAPSSARAHAAEASECSRGPSEDGYYKITNVASGRSLNVARGSLSKGAPVIQWPYSGATNEQWRPVCTAPFAYTLVARHSGLVLDVTTGAPASGAEVRQWTFNGGTNQQWYVSRVGNAGGLITWQLQSLRSGKVIEPVGDGTHLRSATGDAQDLRQQWTFEQVAGV